MTTGPSAQPMRISPVVFATFCAAIPVQGIAADWYAGLLAGKGHGQANRLTDTYVAAYPPAPAFLHVRDPVKHHSEHGFAGKALVGRRLGRHFAVEASYTDYGEQRFGFRGVPYTGIGPGRSAIQEDWHVRRRVTAWGVDLLARGPVADRFEMFAGAGVAATSTAVRAVDDLEIRYSVPPTRETRTHSQRDRGSELRLSVGAAWRFASAWQLRLSYESLEVSGEPFRLRGDGVVSGTESSRQSAVLLGLLRTFP